MADDPKPQAGFLTGKKAPAAPVQAPVAAEPEKPAPVNVDPSKMVGFLKKGGGLAQPAAVAAQPAQPAAAAPAAPARAASAPKQPVQAQAASQRPAAAAPAAARPAPVAAPAAPVAGDRPLAEQHLHKGLDHYDRQEVEQALTEYQACVQADPSFALGHNNLGMVLIDLERYDEAIASLYESIHCDPTYGEAYNNLGFVLRRMQRQIEAACAYRQFLALEPDVEEGPRISGWIDTVMRDNKLTELPPFTLPQSQTAQPAQAAEPEPPPEEQPKAKIKKMAAWEVAAGNVETAAPVSALGEIQDDVLRTATNLPSSPRPNPADLKPPPQKAAAPAAAPLSAPAAARPAAAPARPPSAANAAATGVVDVIEKGMDAFGEGDLDKAEALFKKAIEVEPENAEAHAALGKALVRKESYEAGIQELQQAVQFDPRDPAAYYVLGFGLRAVERNVEASEAYEMFLKLMPDARDAVKIRDWVKHIKGAEAFIAPEDAYVDDEQIVTEMDKKYKTALTHFQDGDVDNALRDCVRILNEDATHYRTRVLLGRIYLRQKAYDNAVEQLEGSLVTRPDYPEALYFLGQAFEKRGSLEQTTATYKHYLDVAPQGPRVERINEWLASHSAGDANLSSQIQCELCLRFFETTEVSQHEGKATCKNCLVVMGASPVMVAPLKGAKTAINSPAVEVSDTLPTPGGGPGKLILGGIAGVAAVAVAFLFVTHRLDPLLEKVGLKKKAVVVIAPPVVTHTTDQWVSPVDANKVLFSNEPALLVQPFTKWSYAPTLAGLEELNDKLKDWKKEYILKSGPAGMVFEGETLVWKPAPSGSDAYEALKKGENYPVSVAIKATAKGADGQTHELFSVGKTFTLSSQFGYEALPEVDLGIDTKDPVTLAAGDLNGDGHADLVTASGQFRHGALRQFINRGENQFAAPTPLSPPSAGRYSAVWIGDLDGDKSADILAVNWQSGRLEPYFLDNNQPVAGKPVSVGAGPVAVSAAEFEGEKKLHVAVLLSVGHALAMADMSPDRKLSEVTTVPLPSGGGKGYVFPWFSDLGPGFLAVTPLSDTPLHFVPFSKGTWGKPLSSAIPGSDISLIVGAAALSAGPGKPGRLALATVTGKQAQVLVLQENGGKFTLLGQPLNIPNPAVNLLACDLNQDGHDDLIVATPDDVRMYFCDPAVGMGEGPVYKASQLGGGGAVLQSRGGARADLLFLNTSFKAVVLRAVNAGDSTVTPNPRPEPKGK